MKSTTSTATGQSKDSQAKRLETNSTQNKRKTVAPPTTGQWKPGQSGNPGGRPKKLPITDALREELAKRGKNNITNEVAIARMLVKLARAGDTAAIREIADRVEGKARQRTEISGPEGGAIPVDVPTDREGLERRIAELLKG